MPDEKILKHAHRGLVGVTLGDGCRGRITGKQVVDSLYAGLGHERIITLRPKVTGCARCGWVARFK